MKLKSCWIKIKEIPHILKTNKKYLTIIILMIFFILISVPIHTTIENNVTNHHSIIDLGFASAIIVGLLGFLITMYTNDKNLKVLKLSLIPETVYVKTELENLLIGYYINQKYHPPDEILLLIKILNIKSEYEVIFRLLAPDSYEKLRYLFRELFENLKKSDKIPEKNAKFIINEILWSVFNENYHIEENGQIIEGPNYENLTYIDAKKRCENQFQFVINNAMPLTDISECNDDVELKNNRDKVEYCMNTQQILNYINTLPQNKTKELTLEKFKRIAKVLDDIFRELQKELSKFEI